MLLPAFAMATIIAKPDVSAAQKTGQLVGAAILIAISSIPILAFFLRRAKAGPRLLKIAACFFTALGLVFPMTLMMPLGVPLVMLTLSLVGTAILSLTIRPRQDIQ